MNIQQSPAGKIVKLPKGYNAFVPYRLPPRLEWDNAVINSLSRADFLLGKLAREGSQQILSSPLRVLPNAFFA